MPLYSLSKANRFGHPDTNFRHSCLQFAWSSFSLLALMGWGSGQLGAMALAAVNTPIDQATLSPLVEYQAATTLIFVHPSFGNDRGGDGTQRSPLRTLTYALEVAQPGAVILLGTGVYGEESGEQFPINLKPGVIVQGDPSSRGRGIIIRGGGFYLSPTFARQNVTILGATNATLTGVTVTNPNDRGYGLWIESSHPTVSQNTFTENVHDGVSVAGDGRPTIHDNYFEGNGANGITIYGSSQPQILGNVFEATGFGINIGQQAAPLLQDNRVWSNRSGIVVQGRAQPVLRRNVVEFNQQDGLVAIGESRPNLGTANDLGQNRFSGNGESAINASVAIYPIVAVGNTLDIAHTQGSVITDANTTAATAALPNPSTHSRIAQLPEDVVRRSEPTLIDTPIDNDAALNDEQDSEPAFATSASPDEEHFAEPETAAIDLSLDHGQGAEPQPTTMAQSPNTEQAIGDGTINDEQDAESDPIEIDVAANDEEEAGSDRSILDILLPVPSVPNNLLLGQTNQAAGVNPTATALNDGTTLADDTEGDQAEAIEIPVIFPDVEASPITLFDLAGSANILSPSNLADPSEANSLPEVTIRATPDLPKPANTAPLADSPAPQTPPSNLLPVPGTQVPEGHLGSLSTVPVESTGLNEALFAAVPSIPSTTGTARRASALRYRVLVVANTDAARSVVTTLVPDAFLTRIDGRTLMQVGAYGQLDNANTIARQLVNYGLQVEVQRMY